MLKRLHWLMLAALCLLAAPLAAQDAPAFGSVSGTVSYRQRVALLDNAEIVVELADVSRADAPAVVLATQRILANGRQVPFAFTLTYESASIVESGRYTVSARILVDGELAWISDTIAPVISNDVYSVDVVLVPVAAPEEETTMQPQFGTVTGTVSYLQRIALVPNAVVQVELEDVSRADAPAFVLASQQIITGERQVPIPFSLTYDAASIDPRGRYNVRARIFIDGALRWISDTSTSVITNGVFNVDVRVVQVSG